ncbi:MAG: xanthine dehydrogenase family protein subunit M [Thermodesulfobacteriota bacterium]|nr:xanthine dehydrogenase family protein subunit M [Thermodesulfobacteriota bacterium]
MEAEVRPLPKMDYVAPSSLKEAFNLLKKYKEKARLLAGGTDLIPKMKKGMVRAEVLIDLNRIHRLSGIKQRKDGLHIGGLTRLAEIRESPLVKEKAPALVQAISLMASPPIRNRATLAGNLCTASPAADTAPPLLVLDASVKLQSGQRERIVPLSEFFLGPQRTVRRPDEIVIEVIIPVQEGSSAFLKLGRRKAFTLAVVSAAAFARVRQGKFEEVRLALGAVAPTPLRSRRVEEALRGKEVNEENIARAAELIREEVKPISDVRASEEYRREMSLVFTQRILAKVDGRG